MTTNDNTDHIQVDAVATEKPEHEIMSLSAEGNPDVMVKLLERKAELASRWQAAIHKILVSCTFQKDWTEFPGTKDSMMCLGSAGAERIGTHFAIQAYDVKWRKEEWSDAIGPAYRYIYEGYGRLGDRIAYAQGVYSSREQFLGYANDAYKTLEEVKETSIRNAAYHIFNGNLIKALLGLRAFPKTEWNKIFTDIGQQPDKAGKASFKTGVKGGKDAASAPAQTELYNILTELAGQNSVIVLTETTGNLNCEFKEGDKEKLAEESGRNCAAFRDKEKGNWVYPKYHFSQLQGKWLFATLEKAKTIKDRFDKGEFADFGDGK